MSRKVTGRLERTTTLILTGNGKICPFHCVAASLALHYLHTFESLFSVIWLLLRLFFCNAATGVLLWSASALLAAVNRRFRDTMMTAVPLPSYPLCTHCSVLHHHDGAEPTSTFRLLHKTCTTILRGGARKAELVYKDFTFTLETPIQKATTALLLSTLEGAGDSTVVPRSFISPLCLNSDPQQKFSSINKCCMKKGSICRIAMTFQASISR